MKKIILLLLLCIQYSKASNAQNISYNIIQNGNYSNLTSSWTRTGNSWFISNAFSCYSSAYGYAYVGASSGVGANNISGNMYQQVSIPQNATGAVLGFMLSVNTDETTSVTVYDQLKVELRSVTGSLLTTLVTYSNLNGTYSSSGCQNYQYKYVFIPSSYFGSTLRINFYNSNDATLPTKFRVDDVALTVTVPCNYTLAATSYTCPNSSAGNYTATNISATSGCTWSASVTSGGSWLSTSSSGSGNGSIGISVAANNGTSSRTGTITAGGKTLTITQPGISCNYTLSTSSYTCPNSSAANYTAASMTTSSGCNWSASVTSGGTWLSTSSTGSGNGSIAITVTANGGTSARTGTITAGGKTLTVTQPGISCNYTLSTSSYTCPSSSAANYAAANMTTSSGCNWSASVTSGGTWLSTSSSGSGNGSIAITVTANSGTSTRTGTITAGGKTLTVTQPGISCNYSLSTSSYTCPSSSAANYTAASMTTSNGCYWSASVTTGGNWLSTSSSGSGNGSIAISVSTNNSTSVRTGTITAGGKTLTVTQPGSGSPDLTIIVPQVSNLSPSTGSSITVYFAEENNGTGSSVANDIGIYLTMDQQITPNQNGDIKLGNYHYPLSLAKLSQSLMLNTTVLIPSNINSGTYYIGIKADDDNANAETNENNNCVYTQINIIKNTTHGYMLPFKCGEGYICTQVNNTGTHKNKDLHAYDFYMPIGSSVTAMRAGKVTHLTEEHPNGNCPLLPNLTCDQSCVNKVNRIVVDHGDGTYALYLHLDENGVIVNNGDNVIQGQVISKSGNSGCSSNPHLHVMLMNSNSCGNNWYCQSIDFAFDDVPTSNGKPVQGQKYYACAVGGAPSAIDSEKKSSADVTIFPNPTSRIVTVSFNKKTNKILKTVLIYNSFGQLIKDKTTNEDIISVDLADYPNGIYFIKINTDKEIQSAKFELIK